MALLAAPQGENYLFVFARSRDAEADMGRAGSRPAPGPMAVRAGESRTLRRGGGPLKVWQAARAALLGKEDAR